MAAERGVEDAADCSMCICASRLVALLREVAETKRVITSSVVQREGQEDCKVSQYDMDRAIRVAGSLLFTTMPMQRGLTDYVLMCFLHHVLMQSSYRSPDDKTATILATMDVGPVDVLRHRYSDAFAWIHSAFWLFASSDVPSAVYGVTRSAADIMYGVSACSTATSSHLCPEPVKESTDMDDMLDSKLDVVAAQLKEQIAKIREAMLKRKADGRFPASESEHVTNHYDCGGRESPAPVVTMKRAQSYITGLKHDPPCPASLAAWVARDDAVGGVSYADAFCAHIETSANAEEPGHRLTGQALGALADKWYKDSPPNQFDRADADSMDQSHAWLIAIQEHYKEACTLACFVQCSHPIAPIDNVAIAVDVRTVRSTVVLNRQFDLIYRNLGIDVLAQFIIPLDAVKDPCPCDADEQFVEWMKHREFTNLVAPLCRLHESERSIDAARFNVHVATDELSGKYMVVRTLESEAYALSTYSYFGTHPRADLLYQALWCSHDPLHRAIVASAPDRVAPVARLLGRLGCASIALELSIRYTEGIATLQNLVQYVHQLYENANVNIESEPRADVHRALVVALARAALYTCDADFGSVLCIFPRMVSIILKTQLALQRTLGALAVPPPSVAAPVMTANLEYVLSGLDDASLPHGAALSAALWREHANCNASVPVAWRPDTHVSAKRGICSAITLCLSDLEESLYTLRESRRLALYLRGTRPYTFTPVYCSNRPRLLDYLYHTEQEDTRHRGASISGGAGVVQLHPVGSAWTSASVESVMSHAENHESRCRSWPVLNVTTSQVDVALRRLVSGPSVDETLPGVLSMYDLLLQFVKDVADLGVHVFVVGGCAWRSLYADCIGRVFATRPDIDIVITSTSATASYNAVRYLLTKIQEVSCSENGIFVGVENDAIVIVAANVQSSLVVRMVETVCDPIDEAVNAVVALSPSPYGACAVHLDGEQLAVYATPVAIQSLRTGIVHVRPTQPMSSVYRSLELHGKLQDAVKSVHSTALPSYYAIGAQSTERRFAEAARDGFVLVAMHPCENALDINVASSVLCSASSKHAIARAREAQQEPRLRRRIVRAIQHVLAHCVVRRDTDDVRHLRRTLATISGNTMVCLPAYDDEEHVRRQLSDFHEMTEPCARAPFGRYFPILPTLFQDMYDVSSRAEKSDPEISKFAAKHLLLRGDDLATLYLMQWHTGSVARRLSWYSDPEYPPFVPCSSDMGVDLCGFGDAATFVADPAPKGMRLRALVLQEPSIVDISGQKLYVVKCRVQSVLAFTTRGKSFAEIDSVSDVARDKGAVDENCHLTTSPFVETWVPVQSLGPTSSGSKIGRTLRIIERQMAFLATSTTRTARRRPQQVSPAVLQNAAYAAIASVEQRMSHAVGLDALSASALDELRHLDPDSDVFFGIRKNKRRKRRGEAASVPEEGKVFSVSIPRYEEGCRSAEEDAVLDRFVSLPRAACPWLVDKSSEHDACHHPEAVDTLHVETNSGDDTSVVATDRAPQPDQTEVSNFTNLESFLQLYTWTCSTSSDGIDMTFVSPRPQRITSGEVDFMSCGDVFECWAVCCGAVVMSSPDAAATVISSISPTYMSQLYHSTSAHEARRGSAMKPASDEITMSRVADDGQVDSSGSTAHVAPFWEPQGLRVVSRRQRTVCSGRTDFESGSIEWLTRRRAGKNVSGSST